MEFLPDIRSLPWMSIMGWAFVLLGLFFLQHAIKTMREDASSRNWPTTTATLRKAEAIRTVVEDAKRNYQQRILHHVALHYDYHIAGETHPALDQIAATSEEDAQAMVASRPVGETRPLYYNPENPKRHRFTLKPPSESLIWLLPFCGFSGFGLLVLYVGRKFYE